MNVTRFLESTPGRLLRIVVGLTLVIYGSGHHSLWGLVLMMAGMVPAVTGFAGICLLAGGGTSRRTRDVSTAGRTSLWGGRHV